MSGAHSRRHTDMAIQHRRKGGRGSYHQTGRQNSASITGKPIPQKETEEKHERTKQDLNSTSKQQQNNKKRESEWVRG